MEHAQRLWERAFRAAEQHASRQNPSVPLPGPEPPARYSIREEIDSSHSEEYTEETNNKRNFESKLPENTTDAGKKGSKLWNDAKKKIKEGKGKGINIKIDSQEAAEKLLNEARPDLEKKPPYSKNGKSGHEIHPAEPDVGNIKPHIKWWDWSNGKATGAEGHIYFD